jgi:hypothetical protein|eukprot:COSAG02_NODE_21870_length_772_cov_0.838039_2_plen_63_part_00
MPLKIPNTRIGGIGLTKFAKKEALVVVEVVSMAVAARRNAQDSLNSSEVLGGSNTNDCENAS